MSVPQIGTYLDATSSDLMAAVESIPAYGKDNSAFPQRASIHIPHTPSRACSRKGFTFFCGDP